MFYKAWIKKLFALSDIAGEFKSPADPARSMRLKNWARTNIFFFTEKFPLDSRFTQMQHFFYGIIFVHTQGRLQINTCFEVALDFFPLNCKRTISAAGHSTAFCLLPTRNPSERTFSFFEQWIRIIQTIKNFVIKSPNFLCRALSKYCKCSF